MRRHSVLNLCRHPECAGDSGKSHRGRELTSSHFSPQQSDLLTLGRVTIPTRRYRPWMALFPTYDVSGSSLKVERFAGGGILSRATALLHQRRAVEESASAA